MSFDYKQKWQFTTVTGFQTLKKKSKPILIHKCNAEIIQLAKTNC